MGFLLIREQEREKIATLRDLASATPVDMRTLTDRLKDPDEKRRHMDQMEAQSIIVPTSYLITYSVETGHPGGTARHLSMSCTEVDRLPTREAVWLICEAFGFIGELDFCTVWLEELQRGEKRAKAVNVVQII